MLSRQGQTNYDHAPKKAARFGSVRNGRVVRAPKPLQQQAAYKTQTYFTIQTKTRNTRVVKFASWQNIELVQLYANLKFRRSCIKTKHRRSKLTTRDANVSVSFKVMSVHKPMRTLDEKKCETTDQKFRKNKVLKIELG